MRPRRIIGSLIGAALVATPLTLVATSAPAAAADPVPTRIVPGSGYHSVVELPSRTSQPGAPAYGDDLYINVNVQAFVNGAWEKIYDGAVTVTQRVSSGATKVVASNDDAYVYEDVPAPGNATYTVSYAGGSGDYPVVNYAPSSLSVNVAVQRKITYDGKIGKRVKLTGKVAPAYHGKVIVQKKVGKHWKRWKALRTKATGRFATYLPAPGRGRTYWRLLVAGGGGFAASRTGTFYTYKL